MLAFIRDAAKGLANLSASLLSRNPPNLVMPCSLDGTVTRRASGNPYGVLEWAVEQGQWLRLTVIVTQPAARAPR